MERWTSRDASGCYHLKRIHGYDPKKADLVQRVGAYEDTGLAPEDLDLGLNAAVRKKAGAEYYGITPEQMEHAVDLFHAEDKGLLVVLPCKIGQTVYKLSYYHDCVDNLYETCQLFAYDDSSCCRCYKDELVPHIRATRFELSMLDELGDGIFLSRKDAEAALQSVTNRNGLERGGFQNGNNHDAIKNWPPYLDLPKKQESLAEKQATSDLYDEDGGDIYE